MSSAFWPLIRMSPGKPLAGSSRIEPPAVIDPPLRVVAEALSIIALSPCAKRRARMASRRMPRDRVLERGIRERDRAGGLRLRRRAAQSSIHCDRTGEAPPGCGHRPVGEARIEIALDGEIKRALRC